MSEYSSSPPRQDALASLSLRSVPIEIIPKLYIGNLRASKNRESLEKFGITHILTVASDLEPEFPKRYHYKIVKLDDSNEDDLSKHFDTCFRFIDKAIKRGAILVHCHAGFSRSPSIAIGYLMSREHMSFEDAFAHVKSKDSMVEPNDGFIQQLKDLGQNLKEQKEGNGDGGLPAKQPNLVQ